MWGSPCESQLSCVDPVLGVVVPYRTELDVLYRFVVRKHSLQSFVKLLSENCNIFWGIELRLLPFFWNGSTGRATDKTDLDSPETISLALAVTNSPPCSKPGTGVSAVRGADKTKLANIVVGTTPPLVGVFSR